MYTQCRCNRLVLHSEKHTNTTCYGNNVLCGYGTHLFLPFSSNRQHLSYDDCLEVRGEIIRTILSYTVYWSCAQSWAHLDEQFLQFSGMDFLTGPILPCLYSIVFVFLCVFLVILHMCCITVTRWWTWWDWSLILRTLSYFSALTLFVGSFKL